MKKLLVLSLLAGSLAFVACKKGASAPANGDSTAAGTAQPAPTPEPAPAPVQDSTATAPAAEQGATQGQAH